MALLRHRERPLPDLDSETFTSLYPCRSSLVVGSLYERCRHRLAGLANLVGLLYDSPSPTSTARAFLVHQHYVAPAAVTPEQVAI
jgi:hypothetical protein